MKYLLRLLSAIPAGPGYVLSNGLFFVLYYLLRYRRSTVRENLSYAFPDLPEDERALLEKNFYRHFCDLVIEVLRSTRMSAQEFAERVTFPNQEVLAEATQNYSRQAIILLVHQGNWEWTLHGAMQHLAVPSDPVYKTLHSPFWEEHMLASRSRFGAKPMSLNTVSRELIRGRKRQRLVVMIADQAGPKHGGYWTQFLNRPASFFRGAEKMAKTLDIPVLFARCHRTSRGHYEVRFQALCEPPYDETDNESLLRDYVATAETVIAEQPETFLWTNRRWKKQPPEEVSL